MVDSVFVGGTAVGLSNDVQLEDALRDLASTLADVPLDALQPDPFEVAVLQGLEHDVVARDSPAESPEQELSPAIAVALVSNEPPTQRRKGNLLAETTVVIERREKFLAELNERCAASETFADEIADIESVRNSETEVGRNSLLEC